VKDEREEGRGELRSSERASPLVDSVEASRVERSALKERRVDPTRNVVLT